MNKERDIKILYDIKCNKYKPEQLTDKLKELLMFEAVQETELMYGTLAMFQNA